MDTLFSVLLPLLYAGFAFLFFRSNLKLLKDGLRDRKRRYEIVSGTIVEFQRRSIRRGRRWIYHPVFEYQWKGKTRRGYGRRIRAGYGPGFQPIPATSLQVGDTVDVRVYPSKLSISHLEAEHWFWQYRIGASALVVLFAGMMILAGLYWALSALIPW